MKCFKHSFMPTMFWLTSSTNIHAIQFLFTMKAKWYLYWAPLRGGYHFFVGYFLNSYKKLASRRSQINNAMLFWLFCDAVLQCFAVYSNKTKSKQKRTTKTKPMTIINRWINRESLTNLNFEQIIYDVMDIFSIGIPCYIIILFVKCEQFNFYHPYAINSSRLATFIPFVSAGSCENLI